MKQVDSKGSIKKRWALGYCLSMTVKRQLLEWQEANVPLTVGVVLVDHLLIIVAATAGYLSFVHSPVFVWLPVNLLAFCLIARSQRALECLVHEASHYNWSTRPGINDLAANLLAALPVFSSVQRYRASHILHHRYFGSTYDPDRIRYEELEIDDLDRSSLKAFASGTIVRLPAYFLSWWRTIGLNPALFLVSIFWQLAIFVAPASVILDIGRGLLVWVIWWLIPLILVLPPLRFVAEAGEHVYNGPSNLFQATITNCGPIHRWLFHPHGDGYHLIHHLCPKIPHYNLKASHWFLMRIDPHDYAARHRSRLRVVEQPSQASAYPTTAVPI
jgi:fatty acid desaturase